MMIVERSYDIEDEVRKALSDYFVITPRPLPKNLQTPSLLVTLVGGNETNKIDAFDVIIDSRSRSNAEAMDLLLDAVATLRQVAREQTTPLRYVEVQSIGSWGNDPVRPDLAMCSARVRIYTHKYNKTINEI